MLSNYSLMLCLDLVQDSTWLLQILISVFLAILFLQSGIDKVIDRRGNLEFLQGHFAKSPLAGMVPLLVTVITILEIAAGALSAIGCVLILVTHDPTVAFYGAVIAQQLPFQELRFSQRRRRQLRPQTAVLWLQPI